MEEVIAVTTLVHGAYVRESPYEVVQHSYRGSETGFCELLEIANAPKDQYPFVVFQQSGSRSRYFEFEDLEAARGGLGWLMMQGETVRELPDGCIQMVDCGTRQPWFYSAID